MLIAIVALVNKVVAQEIIKETSVVENGFKNEWQRPLKYANKTNTLSYNVATDGKYIYFIAVSEDWKMINRVLLEGITLYFDPSGKENKKKMFITFPEQKEDISNLLRDADTTTILNTLVLQSDAYDAENFLNIDNGQYGVIDKTTKIQLRLKATKDSGLVYEVKVPIECVLKDGPTAKNLKKNISIGVIIHANDSWKKPVENGIKNNDNTAAAFQSDNGFGTKGGVDGLGGTAIQNTRRVPKNSRYSHLNNARHEEEEAIWNTISLAN
jgi:hypothetical protein